MLQHQKTNLCTKFQPVTPRKNDVIFKKYIKMIMSSTQNQFFYKILLNTNPLAKFGVLVNFGLGIDGGAFCPPPCKMR